MTTRTEVDQTERRRVAAELLRVSRPPVPSRELQLPALRHLLKAVLPSPPSATAEARMTPCAPTGCDGGCATVRMLVVEDEVAFAEALRDGLVAEGFAVDLAHDGDRGLQLARSNPYDAIVLDLMLPGRHGYDVCRTLRREGVWTPVLMLTAKDGEHDHADALDLGVDAYLTKPSSFVVILATLRALVRRGSAERPAVLQLGGLELDPSEHRVRVGGDPVALRPREFALLHYLLRRPGEAVSKSDVLRNVWDEHYEGDHNIVEVYVSYLRRKLIGDGAPVIETVRGVGYRLVPPQEHTAA